MPRLGFLPKLCDAIKAAVEKNGEGMSNTSNAGVSHGAIIDAVWNMRGALRGYGWECEPGRWLVYAVFLALPFPAVAVRPDPKRSMALSCLTRVGQTIRPMRAAAEKRRAAVLIANDAQLQVVDVEP